MATQLIGEFMRSSSKRFRITACSACEARIMEMNRFTLRNIGSPWLAQTRCRTYTGPCTGFGTRRCVVAPDSFSPDAATVEQCCSGWFQFPWIEVCDGKPVRKGCGFCFW
jgi:hypothetical protein